MNTQEPINPKEPIGIMQQIQNTTLTPQDYEALFHIVSRARDQSDGDHYERLGDLLNKVGSHSVTGLGLLDHYYGGRRN